ncbi:MAG: acyl-CoA reductase [Candidatus Sifarchaeia archaeon]
MKLNDLNEVETKIRKGMANLFRTPVSTILDILHRFSRSLVRDEKVKRIEGIAFLSNWLRRENLKKIIETNLGNLEYLDSFIGINRKKLRAFPRGVVSHWIAGNIPTLSLFSLFQSMLVKNGNVLRIPEDSLPTVLPILQLFATIEAEGVTGTDLLNSVAIVYFPSSDLQANTSLSMIADARVVWGGKEAVEAITGLPKRTHCEDIVFGPKYSFAVFDREALESENLSKYLRNIATDSILFEQSACSSPHVIFVETDEEGIMSFAKLLSKELERLSRIMPKTDFDPGRGTMIINKRAEYALDLQKAVLAPKENDWTILIDSEVVLEDPVQSRTIFLKPIADILETINLITRNVQTIGNCIRNPKKSEEFAEGVMFRGVARVVPPGQMHIYDSPWDGILLLNRLVCWNNLTLLE